jgi:hypothetical protein
VFERYSILSRQAMFVARKEAGQSGAPSICSEHLLIGLVSVHTELIKQLGIELEPDQIRTCYALWHAPSEPSPHSQDLPVADELGAVFGRADQYACIEIRTEHLLRSVMEEQCHAAQLLTACGLSRELIASRVGNVDGRTQLAATCASLSDVLTTEWMPILRRLNALARLMNFSAKYSLGRKIPREIAEKAVSSGWQPPATESEIREAEARLGISLPPSYRSFLLISNGWRPFYRFEECLFPVQQIDRFRICDPENFASFESAHERTLRIFGDELFSVSDEVYLNYEETHGIRRQYYGDSLLIGASWEGFGAKLRKEGHAFLLNPQIVFPNGEWETISAARPASNGRFRSFREFVECIAGMGEILPDEFVSRLPIGDETEQLLLGFATDSHEYLRIGAMVRLADLGYKSAERLAVAAWNTGKEYQRKAALRVLERLNSAQLSEYLELASADGREHLTKMAERIRASSR